MKSLLDLTLSRLSTPIPAPMPAPLFYTGNFTHKKVLFLSYRKNSGRLSSMNFKDRETFLFRKLQGIPKEEFYEKLMELGKSLPPFPLHLKSEENRVVGCQSLMYCDVCVENGLVKIALDSDALISKGLASLVYHLYNGLTAREILTSPPRIFEELDLISSLSMTRLNGLQSLLRYVFKKILALEKM